jgi:hypothetical protein
MYIRNPVVAALHQPPDPLNAICFPAVITPETQPDPPLIAAPEMKMQLQSFEIVKVGLVALADPQVPVTEMQLGAEVAKFCRPLAAKLPFGSQHPVAGAAATQGPDVPFSG